MVVVTDPNTPQARCAPMLEKLLGGTPTEARLALALTSGTSL